MTINVYACPPFRLTGWEWTVVDPVQRSQSLLTGADYQSTAQRRRRIASLSVSAGGGDATGAGYSEVLKRLLQGGVNAVRLYSYPINRYADERGNLSSRNSVPIVWTSGDVTMEWTSGGVEMVWLSGAQLFGTTGTDDGWPSVTVTGLPSNTLVARPGEFVTIFENVGDTEGDTAMVLDKSVTDGTGTAVIRLMDALPSLTGARISLGTQDTGVFRPTSMPRSIQPLVGNWFYDWEFYEVFADEVGGFTELNPWR
jgi:hypothetical protein